MTRIDDILATIGDVRQADQIPGVLSGLCDTYGMKTVAYLGSGVSRSWHQDREPYIAVTYSPEWVERYRACGYVKIDPVIQVGLRRILPIDWSEFPQDERELRTFFGEAEEYGLGRKGMSFPVHGHGCDRSLLSISADMSEREWRWARRTVLRQFPIIATHLHDAVLRVEGAPRPLPRLSRRELECLKWTSEGKTVWECGMILGLSSHTVRCYLESARHKLGSSSNTHAVSLALKSGLLHDLL